MLALQVALAIVGFSAVSSVWTDIVYQRKYELTPVVDGGREESDASKGVPENGHYTGSSKPERENEKAFPHLFHGQRNARQILDESKAAEQQQNEKLGNLGSAQEFSTNDAIHQQLVKLELNLTKSDNPCLSKGILTDAGKISTAYIELAKRVPTTPQTTWSEQIALTATVTSDTTTHMLSQAGKYSIDQAPKAITAVTNYSGRNAVIFNVYEQGVLACATADANSITSCMGNENLKFAYADIDSTVKLGKELPCVP